MDIITRFAPSPTGSLHIGNIRTALYSWLFAKKNGGKFILRIEDSDQKRFVNNAVELIISGLNWLKLCWDEGPYFQTHRIDRYNDVIKYMLTHRMAYKCYCTPERLRALRVFQIKNKEKPRYDGYCRDISMTKSVTASSYVVRFCNPTDGTVTFCDQIRGSITFNNRELDDLIIRRSDGSPTYNFCVVVDDMDMNITHVIRGEEHINNTPRQINILKALQAPIPIYAHVSMILDHDYKKLSKRHNSLLGIMQYRDDGFLPEAILNCLVRLGWSYKDQEIFSIDEMKKYFNIHALNKSASVFDFKKLLWFNHYYINNLPIDYVASHLSWYMKKQNINIENGPELIDVVKLFAKRSHTLKEMAENCYYLYNDFNICEQKIAKSYLNPMTVYPLQLLRKKINNIPDWTLHSIKLIITEVVYELSISIDKIGTPLRVALTGSNSSPEISSIIYFIGQSRVLKRIDQAIYYIHNSYNILSSNTLNIS